MTDPKLNAIPGEDVATYEKRLGSTPGGGVGTGFNLPQTGNGYNPGDPRYQGPAKGVNPGADPNYVARNPNNQGQPVPGGSPSDTQDSKNQATLQARFDSNTALTKDQLIAQREKDAQTIIDSINARFDSMVTGQQKINAQTAGEANSEAAMMGTAGGPNAGNLVYGAQQAGQDAINKINAERSSAIANMYEGVKKDAITESQAADKQSTDDLSSLNTMKAASQDKAKSRITDSWSFDALKSDPQGFQNLLQQAGIDENQAKGLWNAKHAPQMIGQPIINGSKVTTLYADPKNPQGPPIVNTVDAGVNLDDNSKPFFAPDGTLFRKDPSTGQFVMAPGTTTGEFAKPTARYRISNNAQTGATTMYDSYTGKVVSSGSAGGSLYDIPLATLNAPLDSSGRNPQILSSVPKEQSAVVKALAEYKYPLPTGFALRAPYFQKLLELALAYDPSFDATMYNSRVKLRQDFASGKAALNIRGINTAVGHLQTLKEKVNALSNSWSPAWNNAANWVSVQSGNKQVTEFLNAANAVESEMANVFKGTGATDQEIKAWRNNLDVNMSPEQLNGSIQTMIDLMGSRLASLGDQWEKGMGRPKDFTILSQRSRDVLSSFGADVNTIDPTGQQNQQGRSSDGGTQSFKGTTFDGLNATLPDGSTASFPDQESLDQFKKDNGL